MSKPKEKPKSNTERIEFIEGAVGKLAQALNEVADIVAYVAAAVTDNNIKPNREKLCQKNRKN